jgi:acetyltransferase-like isoleucine patch superfamily enzyme
VLITRPRFPIRQMALMGWWPGFLKKAAYRLKGYRIGRKVSLGFGSVVVGEDVVIGDHASISFLSFVRGKHIRIGEHVQIGATTFIDTPHFEVGNGTKINEQVYVGGLQFPDSKLVIGRNCQIMQMSFINPTRSITIGDDSGIGGDCLLFGHTSWLSQLEGYKVDFEPIEIGKSVSLSWRVFVLPGAKIGDGAVIGANSLVSQTIPPKCLAIGYPARVVSKFPDFPKDLTAKEKLGFFENMVREMLRFFQDSGLRWEGSGPVYTIFEMKKSGRKWARAWRLCVDTKLSEDMIADPATAALNVYLRFGQISAEGRKTLDGRGVPWFDVEKKERSRSTNDLGEEVALFLRRYGIRFLRV